MDLGSAAVLQLLLYAGSSWLENKLLPERGSCCLSFAAVVDAWDGC